MSAVKKPPSSLSTIDTTGKRLWIYPSDSAGRYRTRRSWISGFLLLVFLLLPWVRIHGSQAVLLDVSTGKLSLFGLRFWSHDAPMLLFVAGGGVILLAFITAVWGRIWCGWACPQTVFVDLVFRRIERWIEGDAYRRRQMDQADWSSEKILKKTLKWTLYLLISLLLSHSFLAYFTGTEALASMMSRAPSQNSNCFLAMIGMTGAVLLMFGWLREQFCTLICPYGRFQSVLMDEKSLAVTYDSERGEPRRGTSLNPGSHGDCINCLRCVQVCPTGIDIRNGLQLECIGCTACIDACDAVMRKIGKPTGLIRLKSDRRADWSGLARPAAYLLMLSALVGGLSWRLIHREPVDVALIRKTGAPYEIVIRPGYKNEIVNSFKLDLLNQTFEPLLLSLGDPMKLNALGTQLVAPALPLQLQPGEARRVDLFVRFPLSQIQDGKGKIFLEIFSQSKRSSQSIASHKEVSLVGPLR